LLSHIYDSTVEQCHLNLPEDMVEDKPLNLENIKERQDHDEKLMQLMVQYPEWYNRKTINNVDNILCYIKPGGNKANWKIALPEGLIKPTIKWYHQVTGHPGSKRLYGQLQQSTIIEIYVRWLTISAVTLAREINQMARDMDSCPISFEDCSVDLIGPWTVQICGRPYKLEALTVIDTVTNLVELARIEVKDLDFIIQKFAQCWLTHYPWPQCCIHDPGGEFTGQEF
jgi:hypothetical protein